MYKLKTLSTLIAAVAFAGCTAGVQDGGGEDTRAGMTGLVVDGRVANGKVWADRDNDGALDDFEPFAWTDAKGYYSYNPDTGVDYCASTDEDLLKHCLRYGSSSDDVVIRIRGGIDLDTGEKLKGIMAMDTTITASETKSDTPQVLSPLTTLLQSVPAEQKASMKAALGITDDADLRRDFSTAETAEDRAFYAKALAVQTMLDVAFSAGDSDSTKQLAALAKLAEKVAAKGDVTTLDAADLTEVLASAGVSADKQASVSARLVTVNAAIQTVASQNSATGVKTAIKAIEVVSQLVKEEASGTSGAATALDNATSITDLVNTLSTAISTSDIDITSVTDALVDGSNPDDAVSDNTLAATDWAGELFILRPGSELVADVAGKDYLAVYLHGTEGATGGDLSICASVSPVEDLGDEAPSLDKTYFGGSWSQIGPASVSLIIEWEGQEFNGQVKAKESTETVYGEVAMGQFRMTSDLAEGDSAILIRDEGDAYTYLNPTAESTFAARADQVCVNIDSNIRTRLAE